ncbi:Anti-sigma regulatory factor (Ser/Thr protein kinase) [Amycolatopsis arida]|uniref:Anti-sigma regulatory factor (Ser/Thr protein kinase) n=1 Tax=Amycolatopsis arida TaxID=587909 RepID=A0A1I5V974_9PSEU|nr:sensor histidine kinase [Amycolatopsis arida]TDX91196.1 anti-sigma regulatory factor (Ser/Thr protein kinase) [Amycolatopsis arida]SFQ04078.1 Anti-sigma regulatory factor (Ser/Thr protein kinase) [Amycolatopsis arida]
MRSGAAAGSEGYFHQTGFYGSDDEFLALVIPFLEGGRDAGEPTLAAFDQRNERLVRGALADPEGISFVPNDVQYARPASAIRSYQRLVDEHMAAGAEQIRITGDVPHPGMGAPWDWWARYEAAINHALAPYPLWGLCPYDTRTTPDEVLADVARTHPHLATVDGLHHANDRYEDATGFLSRHSPGHVDPLELSPPLVTLVDPAPKAARHAAAELGATAALPATHREDLVMAASEVVTNAVRHGRPPVELRGWATTGRAVLTVTDRGDGPHDPFAGLLPARPRGSTGGLGLWVVHQICDYVTLHRHDDGFTVRLVAGAPRPTPGARH